MTGSLDLLVAFLAGVGIGLVLASALDEVERREAAKINNLETGPGPA